MYFQKVHEVIQNMHNTQSQTKNQSEIQAMQNLCTISENQKKPSMEFALSQERTKNILKIIHFSFPWYETLTILPVKMLLSCSFRFNFKVYRRECTLFYSVSYMNLWTIIWFGRCYEMVLSCKIEYKRS